MSEHLRAALTELVQQRAAIDAAIAGLQVLLGSAPPAAPKKARGQRGVLKSNAEGITEALVAALRQRNPQTPTELAQVLGLSRYRLSQAVDILVKAKQVKVSGATSKRQIALVGAVVKQPLESELEVVWSGAKR